MHRSRAPPLCQFSPSSRYHPYPSSQTSFCSPAPSVATEVTACLPAQWAWCGPPSAPPPHFLREELSSFLSLSTAFNFVPFLKVLVKLPVSTPLLRFRLHWGPGSQACSCQEFRVRPSLHCAQGLLETGPAHLNLLPVLRSAQRS